MRRYSARSGRLADRVTAAAARRFRLEEGGWFVATGVKGCMISKCTYRQEHWERDRAKTSQGLKAEKKFAEEYAGIQRTKQKCVCLSKRNERRTVCSCHLVTCILFFHLLCVSFLYTFKYVLAANSHCRRGRRLCVWLLCTNLARPMSSYVYVVCLLCALLCVFGCRFSDGASSLTMQSRIC